MSQIREIRGVEVELDEILNFGHQYEYFVDMLRDKVVEADDEEYEKVIVHGWSMMGVARPNVAQFDILIEIEE